MPLFMKFKIKYLMTIDPKGPLRDLFRGAAQSAMTQNTFFVVKIPKRYMTVLIGNPVYIFLKITIN